MGWFGGSDERDQRLTDEQAVERYRYMLRTAPPEAIEQAHEEAFAKLTPEQRRMALEQLTQVASPGDRRYLSDDPRSLARLATRAEIRQPGMLERVFGGGYGGGMGLGGMLAGSLLASVAGSFIGSAIAENFFHDHPADEGLPDSPDAGSEAAYETEAIDGGFEDGGFDEI